MQRKAKILPLAGWTLVAIAVVVPLSSASAADGKAIFRQRCAVCHADPNDPGAGNRVGPSLRGIVGRRPAQAPGFTRYSSALKAARSPWTTNSLMTFLEAPRKMVPGTAMAFTGLPNSADRAALVEYLSKTK